MKLFNNQSGMVTLIIVIIISTVALIMAYSATIMGLGDLEMSYTYQQGAEVLALIDGCAEEALFRLRLDNNYNGGNLVLANGSCIITITSPGGGVDRLIAITATAGDYNKKLEVDVVFAGSQVVVSDWRDISL